MTGHLLLLSFDNQGYAVLKRKDGNVINVPMEWLPEKAIKGAILSAALEPDRQGSAVRFSIVSGRASRATGEDGKARAYKRAVLFNNS